MKPFLPCLALALISITTALLSDPLVREPLFRIERSKNANIIQYDAQLAAIVAEQKKIDAWKQAKQELARKKAESDKKQAAAQAVAREKEMLGRMKSDLSDLQRTVARQNQQLTDLRAKMEAAAKKAKP